MNTRRGIQCMFVHNFPYSRSNYCLLVPFHESWCSKYTNHMAFKYRNYFLKKLLPPSHFVCPICMRENEKKGKEGKGVS